LYSPWAFIVIGAVSNALGAFLVKQSQIGSRPTVAGVTLSPAFLGGVVLLALNLFLFARAMRELPIAAAYPVFVTISQTVLAVGAYAIFGERLAPVQYAGVVLAILGVVLTVLPMER